MMMEAFDGRRQPPTDYASIVISNGREEKMIQLGRRKIEQAQQYIYIHTWINEEEERTIEALITCIVHLLHLSKYREKEKMCSINC